MCQVHFGFHRRRTTRKPSGAGAMSGQEEGNLYKKSPNPKVERADGQPHRIWGGGNTLLYGDASASSVDPLRTGDQYREEGSVPGTTAVPARSSRGRRGRRGRLARPCTLEGQGEATATEGEDKVTEYDTEEDFQDLSGMKSRGKTVLPNPEVLELELKSQTNRTIENHIDLQLQEIEKVADRSRNLKGCFVRGLRSAVTNVRAATNELSRRSGTTGIVARLEKENAELRSELSSLAGRMEKLTEEIKHLRKQTQERASKTHSSAEYTTPSGSRYKSDEEKTMERIGALVESKLAAFEARLFPGATHRQPLGTKTIATTESVQSLSKSAKPKRKRKRAFQPSVLDLPPVTEPLHQLTASAEKNTWATVTKKPKAQKIINTWARRPEKKRTRRFVPLRLRL
ncbi:unnamed protein product, partial [Iphiclides podalirius]